MKKITLIFLLCFAFFEANAQDTCATAQSITAGTYSVTAIDGTEIPLPVCSNNGTGASNGEWYIYTPTENHSTTVTTDLQVNICKDTRIQVYTGICGALTCVVGDDDGGNIQCTNNNQSYLSVATFNAMAGTTYYIAFDDKWSDAGFDFELIEGEYVEPVVPRLAFSTTNANLSTNFRECIVDMNNDYLDDVVGVSQNYVEILYQNAEGGFTPMNIPTPSAEYTPSWSTAAGDIDKDGYNDLLYGDGNGVTFMKSINNGTSFTQMYTNQYVFSQRSNFVDINNDGHLDAFVCHDVAPNVFYINDGEGNLNFNQGGIGDYPSGGHYGSLWVDYDNDGDVDMFMAKCGGEVARRTNQLFRNDGNAVFTEVGAAAGLADPVQTWSSAWADYDNDGDMDVLVGASSFTDGGHKLMRNNGDGTFTDVTAGSGWDLNNITNIEHVTYDFDNDGFADVFGGQNTIMFGNGDLTFTAEVIPGVNVGPVGDLNNDGFLDIQNGNSLRLNNGNDNNWIKINFKGIQSNGNGIGARVEIYGAWGKQIRDVRSGEGFAYMSSLNVHFGIGEATAIDQIIVRWPSGIVDTIDNPEINEALLVVEGETLSVNNNNFTSFKVYPNPAKDIVTLQSSNNFQVVSAEIFDLNGRKVFSSVVVNDTISIQSLATGTYILLAKDSQGTLSTYKLIKQ